MKRSSSRMYLAKRKNCYDDIFYSGLFFWERGEAGIVAGGFMDGQLINKMVCFVA